MIIGKMSLIVNIATSKQINVSFEIKLFSMGYLVHAAGGGVPDVWENFPNNPVFFLSAFLKNSQMI